MNKNFLRIINLIEELGSEKKTPITIQQYQDIINKSSNLWMSNGVDEAYDRIGLAYLFVCTVDHFCEMDTTQFHITVLNLEGRLVCISFCFLR